MLLRAVETPMFLFRLAPLNSCFPQRLIFPSGAMQTHHVADLSVRLQPGIEMPFILNLSQLESFNDLYKHDEMLLQLQAACRH